MNSPSLDLLSQSPAETEEVGRALGSALCRGDLIVLDGDLGLFQGPLGDGLVRRDAHELEVALRAGEANAESIEAVGGWRGRAGAGLRLHDRIGT